MGREEGGREYCTRFNECVFCFMYLQMIDAMTEGDTVPGTPVVVKPGMVMFLAD